MSCKPELSTVSSLASAVAVGGVIPLGSVARKRGTKDGNCTFPIDLAGNSIVISDQGYYQFIINATFTVPAPGNVTITLLQNGVPVAGFNATTTVSAADTQVATLTIGAPDVRVFCNGAPAAFAFVVSGVAANFSNVAVSVKKV